jgi:hypothetical protein
MVAQQLICTSFYETTVQVTLQKQQPSSTGLAYSG